jgi:hypothetical protein
MSSWDYRAIRVRLTDDEYRKLRVWAAEEGTSIQEINTRTLRTALENRPKVSDCWDDQAIYGLPA